VRALKQSWAHPLMVLYVAPNGQEITRIGISTSKRIGKAVVRNRVKRLIRESVRQYLPGIPGGRDLVFTARPAIAEASLAQISRAMETLLERARLLPRHRKLEERGSAVSKQPQAEGMVSISVGDEPKGRTNDEMDRSGTD